MKNKISVIVPAYNAEKTIEKCLMSIIEQTYKNLEIIVINDGSVDNTETTVIRLKQLDERVKLFSIPNGGVSNARNTGIDKATGEYITFVDSDDTIDKSMYEILFGLFEKYDVDIVHCSYNTVFPNGTVNSVGGNGKEILQCRDEAIECLISGKLFASGLCNKIYKRDLFNDIRLDKSVKFNEDGLMNFHLFSKAKNSVYCDIPFYNYYQCENSATHTADKLKAALDSVRVSKIIYSSSVGKPYEASAKRRYAVSQLGLYGVYSVDKKSNNKVEIKALQQEVMRWKTEGVYRKNEKIKILIFRYIPILYRLCYGIYDKVRVKKLDPTQ